MKSSNTKSKNLLAHERALKINVAAFIIFLSLALFSYSFSPDPTSNYARIIHQVFFFFHDSLGKWGAISFFLVLAYYNFLRALILILKPKIVEK